MTYKHADMGPNPTAQEVFDETVRHLREQGEQCSEAYGTLCLYRSHDGRTACAVGNFLPDSGPIDHLGGVATLIGNRRDELPTWFPKHRTLLAYLQAVHDRPVKRWEESLATIARMTGLAFEVAP